MVYEGLARSVPVGAFLLRREQHEAFSGVDGARLA